MAPGGLGRQSGCHSREPDGGSIADGADRFQRYVAGALGGPFVGLLEQDGRLLVVQVHAGDVQDRDGAKPLLRASRRLWVFVEAVFADGGYAGKLVAWAKEKTQHALIIVKRPRALPRFEPLPRRWVIERTFGRMIKNRRLVRDFEQRTDVAETLIRIAATATMLRRIA